MDPTRPGPADPPPAAVFGPMSARNLIAGTHVSDGGTMNVTYNNSEAGG